MKTVKSVPPSDLFIPSGYLNIMGYVDESEVNGPGCRAVVWVQGCLRECPGCFNPESWSFKPNQLIAVEALAEQILQNPRNQGVTFSGGEPFWQAEALTQLAKLVKAKGFNVMSFTGFTLAELKSIDAPPHAQDLLAELDILIDGPYTESLAIHSPNSLVSSRNQRVHVFNLELQDQLTWASDQVEIHILKDGRRIITGFQGHMNLDD
ncbi:Anaerobic ribonucleoside-triphosphate reductase-activating protein [Planktothrix tepida]|uniref:Anaerobic ribonucleoside-triphosphate reductase-activating protein n=2 Tax=Planktothrix TaxID=54304 RepID=A0A1J1LP43_9CYAN|nr:MULTISPECIES: 4Fe-4S single cluster domain-containing protein [Planktothrix]CAD5935346.1 Anaerobic ribonucleoside-triphosphate reductase-activating protein [Planktothrix pseudagardhii]CAD5974771.1 Anaerobic ribonucleoside-triphosphate reductase-activating protein [Planktothrix tepida]CUR34333.1 Anaerobic ribonucleoside-triphosphate reductase-activating protein [Planktothrix tepida PCC 9214]